MKRYLILVILFSVTTEKIHAQYVIPDSAFAAYLTYLYPDCMSGKTLDTNCSALVDTAQLYVSLYSAIHSLDGIKYLKKLKRLQCSSMELTELAELPPSLEDLEAYANHLTSLPDLPHTLKILNCGDNLLTAIPALPDSLDYIQCYQNLLTSFPALPNTIHHLRFEKNQISVLPVLPDSLYFLGARENKITTLPPLPSHLHDLDVSENQLTSLPALPPLLVNFYFDHNNISSLPVLPDSIVNLNGARNHLTSLPPLPVNLENLYLVHNDLTSIPTLPNKIYRLILDSNYITSLPSLPESLGWLYVNNNELISIPTLPSRFSDLYCNHNHLTSLPALPTSLLDLDCSYNNIAELPTLPPYILTLYCQHNQLSDLPLLRSEMWNLDCSNNKITHLSSIPSLEFSGFKCDSNLLTSLPAIPMYTTSISCNHNLLTSLPEFPDGMTFISCNDNQLTSLILPVSGVTYLSCAYNKLTSLPALPPMRVLDCSHNLLSTLPDLPDSLRELNCTYNPLSCLPEFPPFLGIPGEYYFPDYIRSIGGLYVKHTNISCFARVPDVTAVVDTLLPVCTNLSDICNVHPTMSGRIYWDKNYNNQYDFPEPFLSDQIIKVSPGNWTSNSDQNGLYHVKLDTNIENTIRCYSTLNYASIFPSNYSISPTTLENVPGSYDFAIQIPPGIYDLEAGLASGVARPGFLTNVTVTISNTGTEDQSDIILKLKKPTGFDVYSSSITPSLIVDDTLIWENFSLEHFKNTSFQVTLQVPQNATINSLAEYEAWAYGVNGDTTPANNYARWTEAIRGSYDPNDKVVNKNVLSSTYSDSDRLIYTIRFQNTGTDTAFTVIVRDTISSMLDISSLKIINASHPYQLIIRDKNIVEIAFSNIQLPDSIHDETASHGFVQLSLKPRNGLQVNDEINNSASILFDYNSPVKTNTARTSVQIIIGVMNMSKLSFKLFPNPAAEKIIVELPSSENCNWQLTDISGKMILRNSINGKKQFDINVAGIHEGTYILSMEVNDNFSSSKIIIVR
ncbi:MAG: hypothetical protein JWN78_302 [Bacteroidota bacterium]|nr:hypothetical protein [Bacteroidota bacterium]